MTNAELGQLYERYGYLVHRRCTSILGDAQDANDALQETFMRVQKYPPRDVTHLAAWLYGVAARVCFDQLAAKRRAEPWPDRMLGKLKDAFSGGEHRSRTDERLTLGQALGALDEKSREIALLHFLDGLTQEEISERVGYSRKTVGVKLKAAEERLRMLLGPDAEGGSA